MRPPMSGMPGQMPPPGMGQQPMPPGMQGGQGLGSQPPPMPPPQVTVHDVKIARTKKYGCARVENVPPEEFGVTRRQRSVMLKDCDYCYHEVRRTEADLIADGYDEDQIKKLPDYDDAGGTEQLARDTVDESQSTGDASVNHATRQILVTEHYIVVDYEGKGKPQRYRVTTGGSESEILKQDGKPAVEPDRVRFAAMTPFIMTHRFFGRSIADLVMDIMRIKTALIRGLLDNVYFANNQRHEISQQHATEDTLDDYLANRPGGAVRVKMPGGINAIPNQEIGSFAFPMIEYMDSTREWRTGVTRQGQGLDPNALQNIGERAVLDAQNAARAKTKLIARIFAETGIKELFWLLHGTIRENATEADTVKLRNEWVPVNPLEWQERDDLTVNVGLGTGSREQEVMILKDVMGVQGGLMKEPKLKLAGPLQAYNLLKQYVHKIGLKNADQYFTDPSKTPDPPPQPTPEEKKLQMEGEAKKMELQFDQAKAQQDGQIEVQKMQLDAQLRREQMQGELALKREQIMAELQLKREMGMMSLSMQAQQPSGNGSSVHVGGEPG